MNPLYFGSGERRIFGVYEPAASRHSRARAAVLCHPWGAEYIYAHRSMRHLALKLSLAGFHTMRFDFFGTGDSAGEMADADLAGWETDVESAMEGIVDIGGAARVTLIGLRLGANIAAKVAARRAGEIEALVLWDPIVSGEEYVRELAVPPGRDAGETIEVQGFPLTPTMLREIRSIDLRPMVAAPVTRSLMLVTAGTPPLLPAAPELTLEYMTADPPWIESSTITGAVPVRVIRRIVEWLG